jgi:hypothetical protein
MTLGSGLIGQPMAQRRKFAILSGRFHVGRNGAINRAVPDAYALCAMEPGAAGNAGGWNLAGGVAFRRNAGSHGPGEAGAAPRQRRAA